jgi:hypothetical protein
LKTVGPDLEDARWRLIPFSKFNLSRIVFPDEDLRTDALVTLELNKRAWTTSGSAPAPTSSGKP